MLREFFGFSFKIIALGLLGISVIFTSALILGFIAHAISTSTSSYYAIALLTLLVTVGLAKLTSKLAKSLVTS